MSRTLLSRPYIHAYSSVQRLRVRSRKMPGCAPELTAYDTYPEPYIAPDREGGQGGLDYRDIMRKGLMTARKCAMLVNGEIIEHLEHKGNDILIRTEQYDEYGQPLQMELSYETLNTSHPSGTLEPSGDNYEPYGDVIFAQRINSISKNRPDYYILDPHTKRHTQYYETSNSSQFNNSKQFLFNNEWILNRYKK